MGFTWEQKQAIEKSGANILVSAGAGSGKTTVLVARIINKIVNEKVDIDKLLIVTFTNAAASEMKERLLKELYKKIDENPNDIYLQKQINLINQAHISTISSFCLDVVRNNFFEIGMSANFRVGDPTEVEIIKQEAIEEVFENKYESEDKDFLELLELYTTYKDDQPLKEIITNIYEFTSSMPYPREWLKNAVKQYDIREQDFAKTTWGKILIDRTRKIVTDLQLSLKMAMDMLYGEMALDDCYRIIKKDYEDLKNINFGNWDEAYKAIKQKEWDKWSRKRKYEVYEKELKDKAKSIRDEVKDTFGKNVQNKFAYNSKEAIEDISKMYSVLDKIQSLLSDFENEFTKRKREKNIVDFSDIEHLALKLLIDEKGNKTHIAKEYEFNEILIDEYQDSNLIQESILNSLSNGKNVFMVGDVKQSIYRFRQARPELFLQKYEKYNLIKDEENLKQNTIIQLYKNFRSREEVLNITNIIFEDIMSKTIGEIDYNKEEYLNPGREFEKPKIDCKPELCIIETKEEEDIYKTDEEDDDAEILDNAALQARLACGKIEELHKKGVNYKDIAILLRSPNNVAAIYEKELTEANIPVFSDATSEYLESIEVDTIMSILKIIDNPLQDIPLVTVLRSPIGGFDDNELIEIRLYKKEGYYYNALKEAEKNNEKLGEKISEFLKLIDKFRKLEKEIPLDKLIWTIYSETGYYHYVRLMPNGKLRQANLRKLFEKAKDYEKISFKGLFNYITFIEKVSAKKTSNMMAAKIIGENDDVVRIMSVHKSKGLEFPIVILCGTEKKFNDQDMKSRIIYDQDIGIGVNYLNRMTEYPTVTKLAINAKARREAVSEEMRILYVALTRAKEKLIIIATDKNAQKKLEQKENDIEKYHGKNKKNKLNPNLIEKYNRFLDWIELVYKHRNDMNLELKIINKKELKTDKKVEEKQELKIPQKIDINSYEKIDKLLNWNYNYNVLVEAPSKTSVTALKNCKLEITDEEIILIDDTNINIKDTKMAELENKKENDKLSPAEKGTLIHLLLQKLQGDDIIQTIENMNITETEKEFLKENSEITEKYIKSQLFEELKIAKKIFKETPFYVNIKYKDSNENVLVQGVIDLYYINSQGKIILVDYKTDRNVDINTLKERYSNQLNIYKIALKKALGQNVEKCCIYSTYLNKLIEL